MRWPLETFFKTAISFLTFFGCEGVDGWDGLGSDHVLSTLHELLVDDFAGIVFASLNVHSFFYDSICPTSESFASAILKRQI